MLRIHKRTINPKALTAGIVAFSLGLVGTGAYVDRMQSYSGYENVTFDTAQNADAGVLGTSSERQDQAAQDAAAAAATAQESQTAPEMLSTSTTTGSGGSVQPASGSAPVASSPTPTPGRGAGSTSTSGTGSTGTGGTSPTITDTLTAPLYDNTCVDSCVVPLLPSF